MHMRYNRENTTINIMEITLKEFSALSFTLGFVNGVNKVGDTPNIIVEEFVNKFIEKSEKLGDE